MSVDVNLRKIRLAIENRNCSRFGHLCPIKSGERADTAA